MSRPFIFGEMNLSDRCLRGLCLFKYNDEKLTALYKCQEKCCFSRQLAVYAMHNQ